MVISTRHYQITLFKKFTVKCQQQAVAYLYSRLISSSSSTSSATATMQLADVDDKMWFQPSIRPRMHCPHIRIGSLQPSASNTPPLSQTGKALRWATISVHITWSLSRRLSCTCNHETRVLSQLSKDGTLNPMPNLKEDTWYAYHELRLCHPMHATL